MTGLNGHIFNIHFTIAWVICTHPLTAWLQQQPHWKADNIPSGFVLSTDSLLCGTREKTIIKFYYTVTYSSNLNVSLNRNSTKTDIYQY